MAEQQAPPPDPAQAEPPPWFQQFAQRQEAIQTELARGIQHVASQVQTPPAPQAPAPTPDASELQDQRTEFLRGLVRKPEVLLGNMSQGIEERAVQRATTALRSELQQTIEGVKREAYYTSTVKEFFDANPSLRGASDWVLSTVSQMPPEMDAAEKLIRAGTIVRNELARLGAANTVEQERAQLAGLGARSPSMVPGAVMPQGQTQAQGEDIPMSEYALSERLAQMADQMDRAAQTPKPIPLRGRNAA